MESLCVNGRKILKLSKKRGVMTCSAFMWLKIGISGGFLQAGKRLTYFHFNTTLPQISRPYDWSLPSRLSSAKTCIRKQCTEIM
jgi:hypothetical protein